MRTDIMLRGFMTLKILERPTTAKELAYKLDVSLRSAYRYIDTASLVFNVSEQTRECLNRPKEFFLVNNGKF